jgi:hypothetical protein
MSVGEGEVGEREEAKGERREKIGDAGKEESTRNLRA